MRWLGVVVALGLSLGMASATSECWARSSGRPEVCRIEVLAYNADTLSCERARDSCGVVVPRRKGPTMAVTSRGKSGGFGRQRDEAPDVLDLERPDAGVYLLSVLASGSPVEIDCRAECQGRRAYCRATIPATEGAWTRWELRWRPRGRTKDPELTVSSI